jgi:hypothetical protein
MSREGDAWSLYINFEPFQEMHFFSKFGSQFSQKKTMPQFAQLILHFSRLMAQKHWKFIVVFEKNTELCNIPRNSLKKKNLQSFQYHSFKPPKIY